MKALFILIFLSSYALCARAEEAPYSMDELLLNCNLIAHIKITGHTKTDIRVHVLNVLHHHKSGIKKGDYLKVQNDFGIICPAGIPLLYAEEKKEMMLFLSFQNGKWYVTRNQFGVFNNGKVQISFFEEGYSYKGTMAEWKADLQDYYDHFKYSESGHLKARYSREALTGITFTGLTTIQYAGLYPGTKLPAHPRVETLEKLIELVETEQEIPANIDDTFHTIVDRYPIPEDTIKAIMIDLSKYIQTKHPELAGSGLQGKCYYTLYFEKDGNVTNIQIIRSLSPEIDAAIRAYYAIHQQWNPALLADGTAVRCRQNFPLEFR